MPEVKGELTASQIRLFDEICAEEHANERTLHVALNFHANTSNRIKKESTQFWDEIRKMLNLSEDDHFEIQRINGRVCVVKVGLEAHQS